jgi:hypothetical protein
MSDEIIRLGLHQLRYKRNVTAGLNPYNLLGMVPTLRNTTWDLPPIDVEDHCLHCDTWTIGDGRHRTGAYLMAGRIDIPAHPL